MKTPVRSISAPSSKSGKAKVKASPTPGALIGGTESTRRLGGNATPRQGRPPLPLPPPELCLVVFGALQGWLKKTRSKGIKDATAPASLWKAIPDQKNYLRCLASSVIFDPNGDLSFDPNGDLSSQSFLACWRESPYLTCLAWPLLKRAAEQYNLPKRPGLRLYEPLPNKGRGGVKQQMAEAGTRRRFRTLYEDFMRLSGD